MGSVGNATGGGLKSGRANFARARRALLLPIAVCLSASCVFAQGRWVKQPSGTFAWLHAVYFVDGARGWAAGGKGTLLSTRDGGASWQPLPAPTADTLRAVFFTDPQTGWLVCEADVFKLKGDAEARSYLMRTADGGGSWSRVELSKRDEGARDEASGRVLRVVFADREHGWAFGEEGTLYATSDGGDTWARQATPTRRLLLGAHFLDARRGWLVGAGATFLHTSDGGATWRAGALAPAPVLAAGEGGATRFAAGQPAARRVNAVSFADARRGWAVGGAGAVYTTDDGGRTWRALPSGTDADLFDVKFLDAREGWAVGADGRVMRTDDGGRTWDAQSLGTRHRLERLFFVGRGAAWAVGFGGTILSYADSRN